jgi:hypothetical protein
MLARLMKIIERPDKPTKRGLMRVNYNFLRELDIYPEIDPMRNSSNSGKTT